MPQGSREKVGTTGGDEPLSAALRALPDLATSEGEGPRLGAMLDRLGTRAHGSAILLLALPDALPLPLPSMGAILGVPLIVISTHLAIFGERKTMPPSALGWRLPLPTVRLVAERIAPVLRRAERWSRPRLPVLAGKERPVGLACLILSVFLFLPIPLVNLPIALGLVILAWGLVQRDGVVVGIGLGYAIVAVATIVAIVVQGSAAFLRLVQ